jgi:peptide/nickel transport system ATP-binding protein
MLDASTRIDVLNLLGDLKGRGLGILFITHDLSLGNYISDRTLILRRGRVVELGPTPKVFGDPRHSYTRALLSCVPQLHRKWSDDQGGGAVENGVGSAAAAQNGGGLVAVDDDHFVAPEEELA